MDFYNIGVSREKKRRRVNFIDADRLFRMQPCKLDKIKTTDHYRLRKAMANEHCYAGSC